MKTTEKSLKYQSPGINEETRYEKLHTVTFENSKDGSILIAREICDLVKSKQEKNKKTHQKQNLFPHLCSRM